jgi:hypothetical protein
VANATGPIDDRAEVPAPRDSNCVNEISADLERGRETLCVRARGMIGRFTPSDSGTIIRYCKIKTINHLYWVGAPGALTSHGYGHSGVVIIHADGPAGERKPSARGKGSPDARRLRKAGEVLVKGGAAGLRTAAEG